MSPGDGGERDRPAVAAAGGAVEPMLEAMLGAGRAAWPRVSLSAERFGAHLDSLLASGAVTPGELPALKAEDLYLVCAYRANDREAARILAEQLQPDIACALRRMGVGSAQVGDIWQLLLQRLFQSGADPTSGGAYLGRGALRRWLHVAAVREASRIEQRARREVSHDSELLDSRSVDLALAPDIAVLKELYRAPFREAFLQALRSLPLRDRTLLRGYYLDGLGVAELGRLHRVHTATAARWLERCREELLVRTREALRERIPVSSMEFESIGRLVQSQLEVSLVDHLGGD